MPIEEQKETIEKETTEDQVIEKPQEDKTEVNTTTSVCNCSATTNISNLSPYAKEFQSNLYLTR